ncbi:MAG: hypothetical protein QOJ49_1287, partial [Actinomycetota bacterium]|nr:hypothetical protein [Actinomycetota bacterium]
QLVWLELTARAEHDQAWLIGTGQPEPGLNALRADALLAAVLGRTATAGGSQQGGSATGSRRPGKRGAARVQLRVTVDLPTLLGLAAHPAHLAGYGPLPPQLARDLAADADWIRWTTDPQTGQLLDLARRRYRPSRALTELVNARYTVCEWPGCNQPAERCDLDHIHDYHCGGRTDADNLGPRCRQHHNAKTHGLWRYRRDPDGTGHLASPLGKTHTIPPPWHPPDPD